MPVWLPYAITWLLSTVLGGAAVYAAMRAKFAVLETSLASVAALVQGLLIKLDAHIEKDIEAHERIASLEATASGFTERLKSVGDMSHRFNTAHNEEERKIREWTAAEFSSLQRWIISCNNQTPK